MDAEKAIDERKLMAWLSSRAKLGIIRQAGSSGRRKILLNSPWREDRKFHLALLPDRGAYGRFRDFKSGRSGTIVDFVAAIDNVSWGKAATTICFEKCAKKRAAPRKRKAVVPVAEDASVSIEIPSCAVPFDSCNAPVAATALRYLEKKRGLCPESLDARICIDDRVWRGKSQGLFGRILVPFRDIDGNVVYWTARQCLEEEDGPRYEEPFYGEIKVGKSSVIYVPDWGMINEYAVIVEGIFCAASLADSGIPSIALSGASLYFQQAKKIACLIKYPVLGFDSDLAGRRGAIKAYHTFRKMGFEKICFVFPPANYDWNSMCVEHGNGYLKDYVKQKTMLLDDHALRLLCDTLPPEERAEACLGNARLVRKLVNKAKRRKER